MTQVEEILVDLVEVTLEAGGFESKHIKVVKNELQVHRLYEIAAIPGMLVQLGMDMDMFVSRMVYFDVTYLGLKFGFVFDEPLFHACNRGGRPIKFYFLIDCKGLERLPAQDFLAGEDDVRLLGETEVEELIRLKCWLIQIHTSRRQSVVERLTQLFNEAGFYQVVVIHRDRCDWPLLHIIDSDAARSGMVDVSEFFLRSSYLECSYLGRTFWVLIDPDILIFRQKFFFFFGMLPASSDGDDLEFLGFADDPIDVLEDFRLCFSY